MYEVKYSKASFEEVLQQAYDSLEPNDIKDLLNEASNFLSEDDFYNHTIFSIGLAVSKNRNISFKQWKAISAYVAECKRKQQSKNNKSF